VLRQRILLSLFLLLLGVLAATRWSPRMGPAKPSLSPAIPLTALPVTWKYVLGPPSPPEPEPASTMLIPTEIPADSAKLLPTFTPPAEVRLLARGDHRDAR
jgi:hypothetical protein